MLERSKIALWLATGLVVLLFGCGGGRGLLDNPGAAAPPENPGPIVLPDEEPSQQFPSMPTFEMAYSGPYSQTRLTSDSTIHLSGASFIEESGNATNEVDPDNADAYVLRTDTGSGSSWSRYAVAGLDTERPVSINCEVLAAPLFPARDDDLPLSCWVGLGNFTSGMWEWFGPYDATQLIVLNSETSTDRYISGTGDMHFAVVTDASLIEPSVINPDGLSGVTVVNFTIETLGPDDEEYVETKPEVPDLFGGSTGKDGSSLPKGTSALIPDNYVKLTWIHKPDQAAPRMEATGYRVYRMRIDPREKVRAIGSTIWPNTTHIDPIDNTNTEPPVPGATYAYFLRAFNAAGWTRLSRPLYVTVPDSFPFGLHLTAHEETYYDDGDAAGFYLEYLETEDELFVTVHARRMQQLKAFYFSLEFDQKLLNPSQLLPGLALNPKISSKLVVENGVLHHGQIQVQPQSTTGKLGDGILAIINFEKQDQPFVNPVVEQPPMGDNSSTELGYLDTTDTLHWYYFNAGDYDQDGYVDLGDLTTLGEHFGESSSASAFPMDSIQSVIDVNRDNIINEMDANALNNGVASQSTVMEYRIYGSFNWEADYPASPDDDNGDAALITVVPMELATGDPEMDRLHFSHDLTTPDPGMRFWVRPAIDDGVIVREGIASNLAQGG